MPGNEETSAISRDVSPTPRLAADSLGRARPTRRPRWIARFLFSFSRPERKLTNKPSMSLLSLPNELLELIVSAVEGYKALYVLVRTNKRLYSLVYVNHLRFRQMHIPALDQMVWRHLAEHLTQTRNIRSLRFTDDSLDRCFPVARPSAIPEDFPPVVEAIKHMYSLKRLTWSAIWDTPVGFFEAVQQSCVDLEDLRLNFRCSGNPAMLEIYTKLSPILTMSNLVVFAYQVVPGYPGLRTRIDRNPFTRRMIRMLQYRCPNLKHLCIEDKTEGDTRDDGADVLRGTWRGLEGVRLWVKWLPRDWEIFNFLGRHPSIAHVHINGPGAKFRILVSNHPHLRTLSIGHSGDQFRIAPDSLATKHRALQHLGHVTLNFDTAEKILRVLPSLTSIVGAFDHDRSLLRYHARFPCVERLSIDSLEILKDMSLTGSIAYFPNLRILILQRVHFSGFGEQGLASTVQDYMDILSSRFASLEYVEICFVERFARGPPNFVMTRAVDGTKSFSRVSRYKREFQRRDRWDPECWPRRYGAVF